jgi:hypothetical protein
LRTVRTWRQGRPSIPPTPEAIADAMAFIEAMKGGRERLPSAPDVSFSERRE